MVSGTDPGLPERISYRNEVASSVVALSMAATVLSVGMALPLGGASWVAASARAALTSSVAGGVTQAAAEQWWHENVTASDPQKKG